MKVVLHAPSRRALERARVEATLLEASPASGTVRIIASLDGVTAALAEPDASTDVLLVLCGDSLAQLGLSAPAGIEVTPNGTELIVKLQRKGWSYVRA